MRNGLARADAQDDLMALRRARSATLAGGCTAGDPAASWC